MTLIAHAKIFSITPVKKGDKGTVRGLFTTGVRGLRGPLEKPETKKKGFRAKLQAKYNEASAQLESEKAAKNKASKEKSSKKK